MLLQKIITVSILIITLYGLYNTAKDIIRLYYDKTSIFWKED
jgi:hypothetical protein